MNLAEWLIRTGRLKADGPALLSGLEVVADYGAFAGRVMVLAGALQQRFSVHPGDRVALFMPNRVEYLELLYAIWCCGAAAVPINYKLHPNEAAWIIDNADAKIVFVDDGITAAPRAGAFRAQKRRRWFRLTTRISACCAGQTRLLPRFPASATTSPGSSIRRGRPASPRALCSHMGTFRRQRFPTSSTWTMCFRMMRRSMLRRFHMEQAYTISCISCAARVTSFRPRGGSTRRRYLPCLPNSAMCTCLPHRQW